MPIKLSELKSLQQCQLSFFLQRTIETEKTGPYYMAIAIRNAVKTALLTKDVKFSSIRDTLDQFMPDSAFLPLVKDVNLTILTAQISRYLAYLVGNFSVVDIDVIEDINIDGKLITVSADLVLLDEKKSLHVVKLKRGEPELTYAGRKRETLPEYSIELYALKLLGEKLHPGFKTYGALHHLKGKNDEMHYLCEFEEKAGHNIIAWDFEQDDEMKAELLSTLTMAERNIFSNLRTDKKDRCHTCPFANICNYQGSVEAAPLEKVIETEKAPQDFALTASQRQAVLFEKGISRINAGAGSGKTTVVALRVNELILGGCDPKDIFLTTFTNKGAQEMREKVRFWLAKEGQEHLADDLSITTFNSWGDKIIRENYKALGFKEEPKMLEKVEKYDILFDILDRNPELQDYDYRNPLMDFRYAHGAVVRLGMVFDAMKASNITREEQFNDVLLLQREFKSATLILEMFKEYNGVLKERNLIEYQDQINLIAQMMEEDSPVMRQYDYKHIIVDEFQDTDKIQVDLVMFLANQPRFESLMVVGDDSQAIFAFRNTTNENILNFNKMFNKVKDIKIMENFRSTKEIVALANHINSLNVKKINKKLTSSRKGVLPQLVGFIDMPDGYEHQKIAEKIAGLISMGNYNPEDIAVIARTKDELFEIQELLKRLSIPTILDVPEPLLNNFSIHMAKNLAQFLVNPNTNQGLFEYWMLRTNDFDGASRSEIVHFFEEQKKAFAELLEETEDEELNEEMRQEAFFTMIGSIEDKELQEFIGELKKKELSLEELRVYLKKFVLYEDPKTIEKRKGKFRAVTLTTAHTSKGKEFRVVFNTITKYTPNNTPTEIEEERRLLFVSITRAKELLFVTYSGSSKLRHSKKYLGFPEELASSGKMASRTF